MIGLVWNSMMSMAGGWFFLMITESFVLGTKEFRLPGIGSYTSVAGAKGDVSAMVWAIIAMVLMIVILDQLLWRPVVVWSQKFRVEEGASEQSQSSWFYDFLRHSLVLEWIGEALKKTRVGPGISGSGPAEGGPDTRKPMPKALSLILFIA